MKKKFRWMRWLLALLLTPVCLFLFLLLLLYLPPVQNYVVRRATEHISAATGMTVHIGRVNLAFPFDFVAEDMLLAQGRDTLLDARRLQADVALRPLLRGVVDVEGIGLWRARFDSYSLIPDTRVAGRVGQLHLRARSIDLPKRQVAVDDVTLSGTSLHVALADSTQKDTTSSPPPPWNIRVAAVSIRNSRIDLRLPGDTTCVAAGMERLELNDADIDLARAHYAVRRFFWEGEAAYHAGTDSAAVPGLDVNHLMLSKLRLQADTLRYGPEGCAGTLAGLQFDERSGLSLKRLSVRAAFDTVRFLLPECIVETPHTTLSADACLDWCALKTPGSGHAEARVAASLGHADLMLLAATLPDVVRNALPQKPLTLELDAAGNEHKWTLRTLRAEWPGIAALRADGRAALLTDSLLRNGELAFALRTYNSPLMTRMFNKATEGRVRFPGGMALNGTAGFSGLRCHTDLHLHLGQGRMHASGHYNAANDAYGARLKITDFPLQDLLPEDSLYDLSARVALTGRGFDVFAPSTTFEGAASLDRLRYTTWNLDSIRIGARLKRQQGRVELEADNDLVQAASSVEAAFTRRDVKAIYRTTVDYLDLRRLTAGRDSVGLSLAWQGEAYTDKDVTSYGAKGAFSDIRICTRGKRIPAKDLTYDAASAPDTAHAHIAAGDLSLRLTAGHSVERLTAMLGQLSAAAAEQLDRKSLDQEQLKGLLPDMKFRISSGKDNPVSNLLKYRGYTTNHMALDVTLDPATGLNGDGHAYGLSIGGILLDTVRLDMYQDSMGVRTTVGIRNVTKYNPHRFEAHADGYLLSDGAGLELHFKDQNGREGMRVGVRADMVPQGGFSVSLYPKNPIIAFRNFTVNDSNYVYVAPGRPIRADIDLLADDGTSLKVYSAPADTTQDITVSVSRLNLSELTALFPFAPAISGFLDGDVHIVEEEGHVSAAGHVDVEDMGYEQVPLGCIGLDAVYFPKSEDEHYVNATMARNGCDVMTVDGTYAGTDGGTLTADLEMLRFPLDMLNGFMGEITGLAGYAEGTFSLNGPVARPLLNGELKLDSAYFYSQPYGLDFRFEDRPLQITDSRLQFDDFKFHSKGKSPLVIRGNIDFSRLEEVQLDLAMNAENFELINTPRTDKSMVFGKVYADYQGTVRGTSNSLVLRGMLAIQDRTDVTYILKDTPLSVEDQLSDLVQFVDFGDTLQTVKERPTPLGLDMTMGIYISTAARAHCELSADGESYVDIEGGGELTMRFTPMGELKLTGRYTVNSGEMKYALPVIPLKTFELVNGSYVEFTGDVANPTLNMKAKERIKASVSENDATRSVAFDVGIALTKPLNQMGLEFTLEAPEDQTVQNQLSAMSREQRAKLAVSMLATGMYLIEGNTSSFKANNALNAFLQSEIQNIAGNALRTVDLSFNVEDETSASGATRTDYSFRFAKRFWGNRVSIIIGGKVSSGDDAQNQNESFIDNVSLEYRLDKSATRYVKVFYDHSTQDPLEGELSEMGAGLVLRRKTNNLGELFIFRNKKKP